MDWGGVGGLEASDFWGELMGLQGLAAPLVGGLARLGELSPLPPDQGLVLGPELLPYLVNQLLPPFCPAFPLSRFTLIACWNWEQLAGLEGLAHSRGWLVYGWGGVFIWV